MFITITRTGLCRIGVGLSVFAVLTAVFILFPRENAEPTAAEQAVPASVSDWGLSFQTEGQPPVGNVSAEELRQYNAFYVGDTSRKTIYLTFDAGYENGCTPAILDALKKHNAPACFFVVGNFIDTAPELVKRMAAEGHIVGNHTLHHPDMSGIADKSAFAAELNGLEEKYTALTGQPMQKFYRPPQGKFSEENLRRRRSWGILRFSGRSRMWTGIRITSRPMSRHSPSCCRGFITGRSCCCIPPVRPMRGFSMNC